MGLLDKVKAQASAATEMAKDAAQKGQAKIEEGQAKKTADGILRDLGAAFYATRTGRATPTTEADIDRLVTALQDHEREHGTLTLAPESPTAAPTAVPSEPAMATDPSTQPPPATAAPASPPPPPPPAAADPASPPPPPPTAQPL